jgi:hypothetical protein
MGHMADGCICFLHVHKYLFIIQCDTVAVNDVLLLQSVVIEFLCCKHL